MRILVCAILLLLNFPVLAQLTPQEKKKSLEELFSLLSQKYIKEEVAVEIKNKLSTYYAAGRYDKFTTGEDFAFEVTRDLQEISKDLHLRFLFEPAGKEVPAAEFDENDYEEQLKVILSNSGYGISKKEILPGNIGYLEIPLFGPLDMVADTLIAAMNFVADTDALILDLRVNRGSMGKHTTEFLAGYFFKEPVHLTNFYNRETNTTTQMWSAAWVPGKKYLDKPVYILTSGRTFSGGEGFAFQMKKQQRAQIIGGITRGGAHPTEWMRLNELFAATVPFAASLDPIDGSTWEAKGVSPHVEAEPHLTLYEAQLLALQELVKTSQAGQKGELTRILNEHIKNKPQFRTVHFELKGYADAEKIAVTGSFNSWERESLFMQRKGDLWTAEAPASPGKHTYMFIVDGKWILDPSNPKTEDNGEYVNSVMLVE